MVSSGGFGKGGVWGWDLAGRGDADENLLRWESKEPYVMLTDNSLRPGYGGGIKAAEIIVGAITL